MRRYRICTYPRLRVAGRWLKTEERSQLEFAAGTDCKEALFEESTAAYGNHCGGARALQEVHPAETHCEADPYVEKSKEDKL
jgi:hypothetical protein